MIDYAVPVPLTDLDGIDSSALESITGHPLEICFPAHTLVIQPTDAQSIGIARERLAENQMRAVTDIVRRDPGQRGERFRCAEQG